MTNKPSNASQRGDGFMAATSGSEGSGACKTTPPDARICPACDDEIVGGYCRCDEDWFFDMDGKP